MSKRLQITFKIAFIIFILLLAGIFAYTFSSRLKTNLEKQQYESLSEIADYNNQTLNAKFEQQDKILEMVAKNSIYYKNKSTDDLCAFLKTAVETGSFDRLGVTDINGNVIFSDGSSGNIAHRYYFKKSIEGQKSIEGPLISIVSGNPILVFSTPIYENNTITGIIHGTYELKTAGNTLLKPANENEHYTIITNSTGEILFCNMYNYNYNVSSSLFDIIDKTLIEQPYSSDDVLESLLQRKSGTFKFDNEGHNNYVFFSPVGINDWYTFQIIPDSALLKEQNSFNKISIGMLINYLVLLCLVFLFLFYIWNLKEKEVKERITKEKEKHLNLLSHLRGGVVILEYSESSESSSIVYMNDIFTQVLGYTPKDIQEKFNGDIINLVHPDDNPKKIRDFCRSLKNGDSYQHQYRLLKSDGSYLWMMDSGYIYTDETGRKFNQILFSDISMLKEHENMLKLNAESMRIASSLISGCVFEYDFMKKKYIILENIDKILGKKNEYILEKYHEYAENANNFFQAFLYFLHPHDYKTALKGYAHLKKNGSVVFQARLDKNGKYIWYKFHLVLVYNDAHEAERVIGNIIDINDTRCQMEHLQNIAERDPLTGIYNRQAFVIGVDKILKSYPSGTHAFFLLDIDNFKGINDNFGHGFGDFVLKNLASCLSKIFIAQSDIVGRIGGDEFVAFMSNIDNVEEIYAKSQQICNLYKTEVSNGDKSCTVSYSVGISICNANTKKDRSTLYKQADAALYKSKENGKNRYTVYDDKNTLFNLQAHQ